MAAGGAGGLLLLSLWCARTPALPVEAATARSAPLRVEVSTNGTVEPLPAAEARIHARLDGRLVEIPQPGTRVAAGDTILRIDAAPVAAELAAARSERLAALESLRKARDEAERAGRRAATDEKLFAQGALTRERRDETRAALAEARALVESLEAEVPLRAASLELRIEELSAQEAGTEVRAPFAGTVYRTAFKQGERVRAGDTVLWLADLSQLRVRANIDQVDLGRVRVGQEVRISSNAWPDRSWAAVIEDIVPHVVVKENRSVSEGLARVRAPNDGLVPGMTVDVDIVVEDVPDALQIPTAAVRREDGRSYVYRVARGRVERTPVVLGRTSVSSVEVVSGLAPEDRVVIRSANGLHDGSRVEARVQDVAAR